MLTKKKAPPAGDGGALLSVRLAGQAIDNQEHSNTAIVAQAAYLSARFGLHADRARLVAAHAFGEGAQ